MSSIWIASTKCDFLSIAQHLECVAAENTGNMQITRDKRFSLSQFFKKTERVNENVHRVCGKGEYDRRHIWCYMGN